MRVKACIAGIAVSAVVVLGTGLYSFGKNGPGVETYQKAGMSLFVKPAVKRDYWPTKEWRVKKPEQVGMSSRKLQKMVHYAFNRTGPDSERKGIRTDAVMIIKNGYLVFEKYAGSFNRDRVHLTWSDSKSFVNAMYGIAENEGLVKRSDFAYKYFPLLKRGKHARITVDHLLRMSSGLYSNEGYEAGPLKSTVVAMLYTRGHRDMATFAAEQKMESDPGKKWEYASPTANLLMGMLKNILPKDQYNNYPWEKLFNKIGMKKVVWEQDSSGTFVGSSYLYTTPRDLARFGFLYLNGGVWNNERILPEGWVKYTTTLAPAYLTTELNKEELKDLNYGSLWWLNMGVPEKGLKPLFPDAPRDLFAAQGHWGQFLYVIPSLDMVVVYMADNREKVFDENTFLKLIIDSIEK